MTGTVSKLVYSVHFITIDNASKVIFINFIIKI